MSVQNRKDDCYLEKHFDGRRLFQCQLCRRTVNSKRSVLNHLFQQHGLSPVKSNKKLYKYDDSIAVPRSTFYRWKSDSRIKKSLPFQDNNVEVSSMAVQDLLPYHAPSSDSDDSSTTDAYTDIELSTTDSSDDSDAQSSSSTSTTESLVSNLHKNIEKESLMLLSCFKKHNLTSSACSDILKTVRQVLPEVKSNPLLHYSKLLSSTPASNYREVHYCCKCENILPANGQILRCQTEYCGGMIKSFMLADVKGLLKKLLKSPGVMEDIKKTKRAAEENTNADVLTDIIDGELYKQNADMNTSEDNIHLTAILNTDGVNLYKSSRVELWPVFLAVNELSPALRFSRENILLIGLWQGKGKPPFKAYFQSISEEINPLTLNGLTLEPDGSEKVFLSVLGVTLDLPAKAGVLNMTLFNGSEACITCEEPGKTVAQGRGYSRCYPYRPSVSRYPIRSSANVLQLMEVATIQNRQKGFKGVSGIAYLSKFDLVNGTAPDYMHCVLLGIVKTLMSKWFSPVHSGKDYFVGKELKQVSERLLKIRPPYYIERLPRDLETHYTHFKATELQAFLLFYAVPCLHGILEERFLQHFALLSEAIFILLGECITIHNLERSEFLLEKFYSQFSALYGEGSCGLNVHNTCLHIPFYVKKLGPIWAWSCFAFEDANSMILQSVHGTGDVVKQALRKQDIAMHIRSSNEYETASEKKLKVTYKAENCDVLGSLSPVGDTLPVCVRESLGVENCADLRKIQRIVVNCEKFYSVLYSRMKKRHCHAVLYSDDKIGLVEYFVLVQPSNKVYAIVREMKSNDNSWLCNYEAAKHLHSVVQTNIFSAVSVERLKSTLLIMGLENGQNTIVAKMPNNLGHAIFK